MKISVCGKGGSGKSTVATLLTHLVGRILEKGAALHPAEAIFDRLMT